MAVGDWLNYTWQFVVLMGLQGWVQAMAVIALVSAAVGILLLLAGLRK